MIRNIVATYLLAILTISFAFSQEKLTPDSSLVNDLKFRSIGPAMASGRIADFAVNPQNPFEFYVAVASGHIWKTTNNGTTYKPVFDDYGTYAIGCLAIDPVNPNIVWAGTGENNSQRALGYGNGIYKTLDGGKSWKNAGLESSRQIGKILIDPRDTDVVYVAAEGSVWGPGGERGIYKSTNGGDTWKRILEISENTGAYDLEFNPANPDIIYATVHQRRRHTFTKINGGPESGFYKSINAGKDWKKVSKGLPSVHLGRIGLSVTPADPHVVYAIVEAAEGKGGFYRSTDQGESWNRMSDYTSSGQYYTTIYADPKNPLRVYSMDTYSQLSEDGGKTWKKLTTKNRHVDDHALWINPSATNHIRIGGDGGVYESFDKGVNWNFTGNLPVTQFYRVNVDNSEPFYRVYGGTQDNNTLGGPSQNMFEAGVSNDEWFVTIGGDGFWIAIDPKDPNIVYSEYQYGNAYRYDHRNGERVYIRPQEPKGELTYRWNWDAPMILSPHNNNKLYMAANKVFMSENRGESWAEISGDLTAQKDRNDFKVMGKYWSGDAVAKDVSTSQFGTLVSLDESRLKEGLIYTGSDDGVIQVTEDMGETWQKAESFPGVPQYTYVSDVVASRFDENEVFASFNNHKRDDFKPYVYISSDKGKSWKSISSNLPEGAVHSVVQDFKDPNMLFCGTEFGLFVSFNMGKEWIRIKNGLPDVAVRDIVIQERESDLVLATFGRGFYILHNYQTLRELHNVDKESKAHIFSIKDAKLYVQRYDRRNYNGDDFYMVKNQPFGAEITYYLKDGIKTDKEKRQKAEKDLFKDGAKIDVNSWEEDRLEKLEETPYLICLIKDSDNNIIRKIPSKAKKGINRIYWDLSYADIMPVKTTYKKFDPLKKDEDDGGVYVMPGEYKASIYSSIKGEVTQISDEISFNVVGLKTNNFSDENRAVTLEFQKNVADLTYSIMQSIQDLTKAEKSIQRAKMVNLKSYNLDPETYKKLIAMEQENARLKLAFVGYEAKASREEIPPSAVPLQQRLFFVIRAFMNSSEPVSESQMQSFEIVTSEYKNLAVEIDEHINQVNNLDVRK